MIFISPKFEAIYHAKLLHTGQMAPSFGIRIIPAAKPMTLGNGTILRAFSARFCPFLLDGAGEDPVAKYTGWELGRELGRDPVAMCLKGHDILLDCMLGPCAGKNIALSREH